MRRAIFSAVGTLLLCTQTANATALVDINPSVSASFNYAKIGENVTQILPQGVQITFTSSTNQALTPIGNASATGSVGVFSQSPPGDFTVGLSGTLNLIANF